ncbi:DNA damage-inducible protein I [Pantoea sp. 1.19]|uniref:DNA damage-inducible protein I n=1 Tax=Pantoea sp. 1.19 TaxID=1925589 RepID=UPI000948FD5B|nr:DNA damage-inducible protein I [Pantoea sp. 1.19]
MRIEVTVAKTAPLPPGAIEALGAELHRRINAAFPLADHHVQVRYAGGNQLTVMGGNKDDKARITDILQETWESADDWFSAD